ncbi:MAG TPA: TnsD family transposase [Ktedonobacteraceae bacterium]|jgi:hypothetical protein
MLGFFPDPHPDELFYSLCARFSERMGYPTLRQVVEELFGDGQVIATVAFPSHLDELIDRLPPGSGYTPISLISDHTLLPFFGPFLPSKRQMGLQADMQGKHGPSLHMRAGVMASTVPLPSVLRYCPLCVEEDRTRLGETYWHRLFQVPGVLVCPSHQVWLEGSTVEIQHRRTRYAFISAEQALQVLPPPRSVQESPTEQLLLALARDAAWLLGQPDLAPGLAVFHQRYLQRLFEKNLATPRGRIAMAALKNQFLSIYPHEVLQSLACDLDPQISDHWLARLVRKPKGTHHPLRHLLLMHFLGYSAAEFFALPVADHPFGEYPWPCLNPVCHNYRKPAITSCQVVYPPSMGGHPTGIFTCACGFVYARSGPDTSAGDRCRRGKIIQFGSLWEETLRRLWSDASYSVNAISRHLGVDPLTVKRSAVRLGLPLTRRHEDALIQLKPVEPSHTPPSEIPLPTKPASLQEFWLTAMQTHPEWGTKALRKLLPGIYTRLYRHDKVWLQAHLPTRHKRGDRRRRVNWVERDTRLAGEVKRIAAVLKGEDSHPKRVTVATIGIKMGKLALIQQHLDKLPRTAAALAEVIETREGFALRRIQSTTTTYLQMGYYPQRWEFIRQAGIERMAAWPAIEEALHIALQRLRDHFLNNVAIVSTSCPV